MPDRFDAFVGTRAGKLLFAAWCIVVPFFSWDIANYGISIYTAAVLVFGKAFGRADRKAVHVKLDDLECAVEAADSSNKRLEELTEQEIEERRT